jgi:hypothetical protein
MLAGSGIQIPIRPIRCFMSSVMDLILPHAS